MALSGPTHRRQPERLALRCWTTRLLNLPVELVLVSSIGQGNARLMPRLAAVSGRAFLLVLWLSWSWSRAHYKKVYKKVALMGSYLVRVLIRYRDGNVCSREVASNIVRASTRVAGVGLGSMHL